MVLNAYYENDIVKSFSVNTKVILIKCPSFTINNYKRNYFLI